jgi:hypothetical protein
MAHDTIKYKDIEYPVRDVYIKAIKQTVNVSTESLSHVLCPDGDWNEVGIQETYIDEKIYFYAPDELVNNGSIKALTDYVNNNS